MIAPTSTTGSQQQFKTPFMPFSAKTSEPRVEALRQSSQSGGSNKSNHMTGSKILRTLSSSGRSVELDFPPKEKVLSPSLQSDSKKHTSADKPESSTSAKKDKPSLSLQSNPPKQQDLPVPKSGTISSSHGSHASVHR